MCSSCPCFAGQVTALSVDRDSRGPRPFRSRTAPSRRRAFTRTHASPLGRGGVREEIGRRHGPAGREVVERLVGWAEQRERELARATGVQTKKLTRFPTNGRTTEPELFFPVDLDLEPRGSQPTISIHADGTVVVWLGDAPPAIQLAGRPAWNSARPSTRSRASRSPNGRSRAGLVSRSRSSQDPQSLGRFIEVLDRLATESHTASAIADPKPDPLATRWRR